MNPRRPPATPPRAAPPPAADDPLRAALSEALALLQDHAGLLPEGPLPQDDAPPDADAVAARLPSLLARCEALVAEAAATGPEPIRTVHHFACTGGTLICRCLAALPNTVLLSEIDPLSENHLADSMSARFAPTDLLKQLRYSRHDLGDAALVAVFRAGLDRLHGLLSGRGLRLVLRDHPHSRFCTAADAAARPGLRDMLRPDHVLHSAVTVRHPLDSFLSLEAMDWLHFAPPTPEEYARRYLAFLDDHADLPLLRYEDFIADPEAGLATLCRQLALPFEPLALTLQAGLTLSGDSGRAGPTIASRPRRPVPAALAAALAESPSYGQLCARLHYDPAP